jgi:hypothetical protein
MQYSSIVFTSILAALVSASPAIDPLTVTSLSPAQVSIPPSSSFAKSHSETDLETSGKRQLVRHTTVTLVNQTTTIYLHVKPSHWLYTRNCTHSEPNLETLEKRQLAGHSTAIVVNQTSTTIWLGSPITESLVTGLSPRSTLFENDETTNLCLLPGSCQTLTQTPLNKATPAITGPSLTKRPQDDMDSHHVTMSTLYLVSKHVRTCLSSTQTFHQNGSVSACLHGAVYDQAHPTSSLYATIKPALETFSSKEILFTESLTSVYRYTAPPPHGAFVSALAEIALIGTVWETGRYKQTWESLSATTIYRPTCRWTTRFHGDNKPTWTDTMSDCQPSSVPETTSIWMPYMTVTTTSYPPDLVCTLSFPLLYGWLTIAFS